jgi:hypothetical protein
MSVRHVVLLATLFVADCSGELTVALAPSTHSQPDTSEQDVLPLALRYRRQLLERVEASAVTRANLEALVPAAPEQRPSFEQPIVPCPVLLASERCYRLVSLQL